MASDPPVLLGVEEFESLPEVSKGDAQGDIPQLHQGMLGCSGFG
jgi:hypothetical protein